MARDLKEELRVARSIAVQAYQAARAWDELLKMARDDEAPANVREAVDRAHTDAVETLAMALDQVAAADERFRSAKVPS